jgi:glucose/arabinose dehydrogenase
MRLSPAAAALLLWITALASVIAVPDGFEDRAVILEDAGLLVPTDFTFTPGGQLLVVNKGGQLFVFDDPDGDNSYSLQTEALDLSPVMCINGERGMQGIEVHPDFENTRFIYIFYNVNKNGNCDEDPVNGPVNRLSRFVLSTSNIVDIDSETVFFETPSLEYDHHNSGDIAFGNDGYLYVSVGDGGSTWRAVSSNPGNLLGSIIRLTADGGIPEDNPYTPQSGEENSVRCNVTGVPPSGSPQGAKCQEIFNIGLRNPFRFAIDPNVLDKVRFYINDVGQGVWEEINEGCAKESFVSFVAQLSFFEFRHVF